MKTERTAERVRVFIVDDHPIVRGSLREMFEATSGLIVCGEAGSCADAIRQLDEANPHVVTVDLGMQTQNGFELLRYLREHHPQIRPLVFSMYEEARYALRAIKAGAQGYLMKTVHPEVIVNAVFEANQGKVVVSEAVQQQLLLDAAEGRTESNRPDQVLSGREWQMFECLGRGLTMKEAAEHLQISEKTAGSYSERIKTKLNMARLRDVAQMAHDWLSDNAL